MAEKRKTIEDAAEKQERINQLERGEILTIILST